MKNLLNYMDGLDTPRQKTEAEKVFGLVEEAYFTCCDQIDQKYGIYGSSKMDITKTLEDCLSVALRDVNDTSEARNGIALASIGGAAIRPAANALQNLLASLPETPTGVPMKHHFERAEAARLAQLNAQFSARRLTPARDYQPTALHVVQAGRHRNARTQDSTPSPA